MKQSIFIICLLLMAIVYGSWRNGTPGGPKPFTPASPSAPKAPPTTAPHASTGNGQPVTRDQYQPCLDSFVSVMGRYGIQPGAPVKNPSCPTMTYPITTSESFQASGFIAWLQGETAKWDPDGGGANLDFQLSFGVCTASFVSSVGQSKDLIGRISVFVIPAYRTSDAAIAAKAKVKAKATTAGTPPGDPGDDGYELGGLHP